MSEAMNISAATNTREELVPSQELEILTPSGMLLLFMLNNLFHFF